MKSATVLAAVAAVSLPNPSNGILPCFNAQEQVIDFTGGYAFLPTGLSSGDLRGLGLRLNALANHNCLPHNRFAKIDQFDIATSEVLGMMCIFFRLPLNDSLTLDQSLDLGTFLADESRRNGHGWQPNAAHHWLASRWADCRMPMNKNFSETFSVCSAQQAESLARTASRKQTIP
jgi:hypothetical protein